MSQVDRPPKGTAEFVRGLRLRHPLVLVAALVLVLPALYGLDQLFASGAYSTVPERHLLRGPGDDFLHVSWVVARLKRQPPAGPLVAVLGGSSARECIESGDSLAARIQAVGGPAVNAYDLGSSMQDFGASWAIVENLPAVGGVVVIGVNVTRFVASPATNEMQTEGFRLLLPAPALRETTARRYQRRKWTRSIIPGVADYFASYLRDQREDLRSFRLPSTTYVQHRYSAADARTATQKRAIVERWLTLRAPQFQRNVRYNLDLLDGVVALAQRRGFDVLLMELPENQQIIGDQIAQYQRRYKLGCQRIATQRQVEYVDLNALLQLPDSQYYDLFHLLDDGRRRWEAALADVLADMVSPQAEARRTGALRQYTAQGRAGS